VGKKPSGIDDLYAFKTAVRDLIAEKLFELPQRHLRNAVGATSV
jgi:hypothetical protein